MEYNVNGSSLNAMGFIPGRQGNGSSIAISGVLDMPARLGVTYFDWADEDGIEPYVSAEDIATYGFSGRDLNLKGYVRGLNRDECEFKAEAIGSAFNGLVPLTCAFGTFLVYVSGAISVGYLDEKTLSIEIPLREPVVNMTGIIPTSTNADLGIDGIPFTSFGATMLTLSGDRRNKTAPKSQNITVSGREGYQQTKLVAPVLAAKLFIKSNNYLGLKANTQALMALFASPGMRYITVNHDKIRSVFVKDGFKVSSIYSRQDDYICIVEVELTQSGYSGSLYDLVDIYGRYLTIDNDNIQARF